MSAGEAPKLSIEEMLLKLQGLIKDPTILKKAQGLLTKKEETEQRTVTKTAKNFRHVMIHTTCEHCGFMSHRLVELGKKDSISFTSKIDKQVHIVHYVDCKELINVQATSRTCNACGEFINKMDIDELKIRYWNAINNNPADMKHPPLPPYKKKLDELMLIEKEDSIIQENEVVVGLAEEVVEVENYEDELQEEVV